MKDRIKTLRKEKRLTLQELADKAGSAKSYMWELENNDKPNTSASLLLGIAAALDTTIEYLLNGMSYKSDDELLLLRGYRLLTTNEKTSIKKIITSFTKS